MLHVILLSQSNIIECADLVEVRKKYVEERSLYSLFRNVNPEKIFDFLKETGMFLEYVLCCLLYTSDAADE